METDNKPNAMTPPLDKDAHETKLIAMAYAQAEHEFSTNDASSQVELHFLKMGSRKEELMIEQIKRQNLLLEARIKEAESTQRIEDMLEDVKSAIKLYSGHGGSI